ASTTLLTSLPSLPASRSVSSGLRSSRASSSVSTPIDSISQHHCHCCCHWLPIYFLRALLKFRHPVYHITGLGK
ncbi:hypothetical protein KXW63_002147, partial [Aspergillus fumigatus]